LLGKRFEDQSVTSGAAVVSRNEAEISHYKGMPVIGLREKPLLWWNLNKHILPKLATWVLWLHLFPQSVYLVLQETL